MARYYSIQNIRKQQLIGGTDEGCVNVRTAMWQCCYPKFYNPLADTQVYQNASQMKCK